GSYRSYFVRGTAHQNVEVAVHKHGTVNGQPVQHFLNVSLGNTVARVRHGTVTLRFGLKLTQQLPLSWYLNDLVEHHTVRVGDAGKERKQVCSNSVSVDVHLRVRLYHGRQVYLVNIHQ